MPQKNNTILEKKIGPTLRQRKIRDTNFEKTP